MVPVPLIRAPGLLVSVSLDYGRDIHHEASGGVCAGPVLFG